MKFSNNAKAALADPDTRRKVIELTPELKEKYGRVAHELDDFLRARTSGPMEAYMVLQFVVHAFEECYGIRGGIIVLRWRQSRQVCFYLSESLSG